jgi:hypothetical protein
MNRQERVWHVSHRLVHLNSNSRGTTNEFVSLLVMSRQKPRKTYATPMPSDLLTRPKSEVLEPYLPCIEGAMVDNRSEMQRRCGRVEVHRLDEESNLPQTLSVHTYQEIIRCYTNVCSDQGGNWVMAINDIGGCFSAAAISLFLNAKMIGLSEAVTFSSFYHACSHVKSLIERRKKDQKAAAASWTDYVRENAERLQMEDKKHEEKMTHLEDLRAEGHPVEQQMNEERENNAARLHAEELVKIQRIAAYRIAQAKEAKEKEPRGEVADADKMAALRRTTPEQQLQQEEEAGPAPMDIESHEDEQPPPLTEATEERGAAKATTARGAMAEDD